MVTKQTPRWKIAVHHPRPFPANAIRLLRRAVRTTLEHFDVAAAKLSIALISDRQIAKLHRFYQHKGGATDVLAFDLRDDFSENRLLQVDGEIVISWDTARRQARRFNHPTGAETALYAVHGLLHLLGFSDDTPKQARHMHAVEDMILVKAGIGRIYDHNG